MARTYAYKTKVTELSKKDQVSFYIFLTDLDELRDSWLSLEDKFMSSGHQTAFTNWSGGVTTLDLWISKYKFNRWLKTLN